MSSWEQYKPIPGHCKWLLAGMLVYCGALSASPALEMDMGSGSLGPVSWESIRLLRQPGLQADPALVLNIAGLRGIPGLPSGNLNIQCGEFLWEDHGARCSQGRLRLPADWLALSGELDVRVEPTAGGGHRLELGHPKLQAMAEWSARTGLRLSLIHLDLTIIQPLLQARLDLSSMGGDLSGEISLDNQGMTVDLAVTDQFFDTRNGLAAGDGLDLGLTLSSRAAGDTFVLDLEQTAGELLLGPVYLPPPAEPVVFASTLALDEQGRWTFSDLRFTDPGSLSISGAARVTGGEQGWHLTDLRLDTLDVDLAGLWTRWLDGPAAAVGFPDFAAEGQLEGSLVWQSDGAGRIDLRGRDLGLSEPRGRVGIEGLNAQIKGSGAETRLNLSWEALELLGLILGPSDAGLYYDEVGLRLLNPVTMALLDGAVVVEGLAWLQAPELESKLVLDARIEPVDLATLTGRLGLPELGGQLAGRFPGVTYSEQRLAFTGGIDIDAFSGRIGIEELVVERLFGTAPALSAQVELERLDLLELTGAFGFGRMEGQASGWVRDLRLLNWRPVAMDARIYTHKDAPGRRISQRAVDNLSSLGGGGSAVISGTVLRLFEDFPYEQAGLACRLDNNVCRIDGIGPHESGGFLIVEGRGLPRLDVVGHRRLVDWPRLTGQLAEMMTSGSADAADNHGGATP